MAFARTGGIRPSVVFIGGLARSKSLFQSEFGVIHMCDLVEYSLGADDRQVVINTPSSGDIPFKKTDDRSSASKMCGQFGSRGADQILRYSIGIVGDDDAPVFPFNPVQIWNGSLDVETAPIWAYGLADRAAPVIDA